MNKILKGKRLTKINKNLLITESLLKAWLVSKKKLVKYFVKLNIMLIGMLIVFY